MIWDLNLIKKLSFSEHMHEKLNKAFILFGIIKRNFIYMDKPTKRSLFYLTYYFFVIVEFVVHYSQSLELWSKYATPFNAGLDLILN